MTLENVIEKLQGTRISDMTKEELVELFGAIAQRAAYDALKSVGLDDKDAINDMKDMRNLLAGYRVVRKGALQRIGSIVGWIIVFGILGVIYNSKTTTEIVKLFSAAGG